MSLLVDELGHALPLIFHGDPYLLSVIWFTLQVAVIATVAGALAGLPLALVIALGRFRGRRALQVLANASLGLPPVIVGFVLYLCFTPQGPFGGLNLPISRQGVFVAQSVLALPYVVALSAAAIQGLPAGLIDQARALGASRLQVAALALREARVGVMAAVIASLGTALSEVGAVVIVGGNIYGYDQTLASSALYEANASHYASALATGIVLVALILVLMGGVSLLQHQGDGIRLRFAPAS